MIPTATYRLQFRNGMTFDRAAALVPYLKNLGISHLYASPIFMPHPSLPPPKRQRMVMMSPMRMRLSLLLAGAKDLKDWWLNLKRKVWD
ncbi:hypothetical protein SEL4551_23160 [Salmonella enterica subsp. enterica serovar 4,[5],12:i:-]|uniref:Uncharacterized protein n=1 Tax=Salmonella enterica subsp. enterica serovar 4,[5],12:i:- TaxID=440524 RepID=A0A8D5CXH9_SALET|nr:hypothetical protein SEL4551_23160 [Salmonella enterica subsp. enterica serovar 4,[5],12:i:-]